MTFGERVKKLRQDLGFSQEALGAQGFISTPGWIKIENGQRQASEKLINNLVTWLVGDKHMRTGAAGTLKEELLTLKYLGSNSAFLRAMANVHAKSAALGVRRCWLKSTNSGTRPSRVAAARRRRSRPPRWPPAGKRSPPSAGDASARKKSGGVWAAAPCFFASGQTEIPGRPDSPLPAGCRVTFASGLLLFCGCAHFRIRLHASSVQSQRPAAITVQEEAVCV